MNRSGLIKALRLETGLAEEQAKEVVHVFFDKLTEALAAGNRVEIRGLCSFFVKDYRPYTGRNPKTGKKIRVGKKKLPFFKAGLELKRRVSGQ